MSFENTVYGDFAYLCVHLVTLYQLKLRWTFPRKQYWIIKRVIHFQIRHHISLYFKLTLKYAIMTFSKLHKQVWMRVKRLYTEEIVVYRYDKYHSEFKLYLCKLALNFSRVVSVPSSFNKFILIIFKFLTRKGRYLMVNQFN